MDAIAVGNRDPWQRYLDDDVVVTAEDGRTWRKRELIGDLRPFPKELTGQRTGRKPEALRVEVADYLFVPEQPRLRKVFQRNTDGTIAGFVERRENWDIAWRRVK